MNQTGLQICFCGFALVHTYKTGLTALQFAKKQDKILEKIFSIIVITSFMNLWLMSNVFVPQGNELQLLIKLPVLCRSWLFGCKFIVQILQGCASKYSVVMGDWD